MEKNGIFILIIPNREQPSIKKIIVSKKYVSGLIKKVNRNKPNIEDIIPKIVYTEAMPKTNTMLMENPFNLLALAAAPVTPKVIGISG